MLLLLGLCQVEAAVARWSGEGCLLFTSSTAVYEVSHSPHSPLQTPPFSHPIPSCLCRPRSAPLLGHSPSTAPGNAEQRAGGHGGHAGEGARCLARRRPPPALRAGRSQGQTDASRCSAHERAEGSILRESRRASCCRCCRTDPLDRCPLLPPPSLPRTNTFINGGRRQVATC